MPVLNAWGTDVSQIDADEFCIWCEHSTDPQTDGTHHYDNCTRHGAVAREYYAARHVHTGFELGAL